MFYRDGKMIRFGKIDLKMNFVTLNALIQKMQEIAKAFILGNL